MTSEDIETGVSQSQPCGDGERAAPTEAEGAAVLVPVWPSIGEIQKAGWAWRNDKERETDSGDQRYFENNWHSLPGLGEYVTAEIKKRPEFAKATGGAS